MEIEDIIDLKNQALAAKPISGEHWPPSVYYRFLGLVARKLTARVYVGLGLCGGGCARTVAAMNPQTKVIGIDIEPISYR